MLTFMGDPKGVAKVRKLLTLNKATVVVQKNSEDLDYEEIQLPRKKVKVECIDMEELIVSDGHDQKPWKRFECIHLTDNDKGIITKRLKLTNNHINFAQTMLKQKFPYVTGLQLTYLLHTAWARQSDVNALQTIHNRGDHWLVMTTTGCSDSEVKIFDSAYSSIDEETSKLVCKLLGRLANITVVGIPKQLGSQDCGIFAIAIATSLATGSDPAELVYDQAAHLVKCFENLCLSPFPCTSI